MGKTLRADIVLGGKADASFYKLGDTLGQLGRQVNLVSEKLIRFGKESVDAYVSFEDYMLDAEVALKSQYKSTGELGRVMDQLNQSAMKWASDSRFTTEDVAGAISNAAHAGWDLEKMLTGVPSAMKISLAGGMDLAQGLEYLVDISNAAGVEFNQLGELVDYWAFAANRSSTTIPEMGQAMQKMGATMQFVKGDMAGLTTMLSVLANNGAKGTEAGTLLRNSFIRLIAPTKKAADAMDDLILSSEDLDDIYSNAAGLEEAAAMLEEAGFSAYDSQGQLKSFMTIWQELNKATTGMSEQDRNSILSAIFPTRTITGALALLNAASEGWDGLYDAIRNHGKGYADYAAEKMESGLGGTLRHLESVYNALQTKTGKSLSGDIENVAGWLSTIVESINSMDNAVFDGMVSGLEAIAVAGPALLIAGGAIKSIAAIAATGPAGQLTLLGIGLSAVAKGVVAYNDAMYDAFVENSFGELNLDTGSIGDYLSTIGGQFDAAQESIAGYNAAVEAAFSEYSDASGNLKENLLSLMLTNATLSSDDISRMHSIGNDMRTALLEGINASYSGAEEAVTMFAGGNAKELVGDGMWGDILKTLDEGYGQAISKAEELSNDLRGAMTSAFSDGKLTSDELSNIQSIMDQMNEMIAIQADAQNYVERQKALRKAQSLSADSFDEVLTMVSAQMENDLAPVDEAYWRSVAKLQETGVMRINSGSLKEDGTLYTQEDLDREQDYLRYGDPNNPYDGYEGARGAASAGSAKFAVDLLNAFFAGGELSDAYSELGGMANQYLTAGVLGFNDQYAFNQAFDKKTRRALTEYIAKTVTEIGGAENVQATADYYAQTGDVASANMLMQLLGMYDITQIGSNGVVVNGRYSRYFDTYTVEDARIAKAYAEKSGHGASYTWDMLQEAMETGVASGFETYMAEDKNARYQAGFNNVLSNLKDNYDLSAVSVPEGLEGIHDYAAAWRLMFDNSINAEDYRIPVTAEIAATNVEQLGNVTVPVTVEPQGEGLAELENQSVEVDVNADTTELDADIMAEDGKDLTAKVAGDTRRLSQSIFREGGKWITAHVSGDTSALASAIAAYENKEITVKVNYSGTTKKYKTGGRATEASIFGEAGPEWAIPEEHTQRTAELLNATREASGFTWPDLIGRNGGLNAGVRGNWTLVYSPVIYAADATGVEQKLQEDKSGLEKWLRDKELHDSVEVYS